MTTRRFADADLSGADLSCALFVTQMQVNAARGDTATGFLLDPLQARRDGVGEMLTYRSVKNLSPGHPA